MLDILVINLDDQVERFRSLASQLDRLGLSCRRVAGIDGRRLTEPERETPYSASLNARIYYKPLSVGEIGCYTSHRKAWRTIVDEGLDHAVVLEDDCIVGPSIRGLPALLSRLAHWDYIKLTGPKGGKKIRDSIPLSDRHGLVYYDKVPTSALGQVMSRRGAQKLLDASDPFGRPVDVDIQHDWERGIHVLGIEPAMVRLNRELDSMIATMAAGTGRELRSSFLRRVRYRLPYEWGVRTHSRPPLSSFLED